MHLYYLLGKMNLIAIGFINTAITSMNKEIALLNNSNIPTAIDHQNDRENPVILPNNIISKIDEITNKLAYITNEPNHIGNTSSADNKSRNITDTKTLLDMKINPETLHTIHQLFTSSTSPSSILSQVNTLLLKQASGSPGGDIVNHLPTDFSNSFLHVPGAGNPHISEILHALNDCWRYLSKVPTDAFQGNTTLLKTSRPFFVPGGRFREFYYWDSFWILKGLLGFNMMESVQNVMTNFVEMVFRYGFIPNGSRSYYLGRTQPPLFLQMLRIIFEYNEAQFGKFVLGEGLDAAIAEHRWLETNRGVVVDRGGVKYRLNRYYEEDITPRLESYREDLKLICNLKFDQPNKRIFSHLRAAAESGWDFSSRWLIDFDSLATIHTADFIPVDLNAVMYGNERTIASLLRRRGDYSLAETFEARAAERLVAIQSVLWNPARGIWTDFDSVSSRMNDRCFYFSNITPLVFGIDPPIGSYRDILRRYSTILFGYPGGIPASGTEGGSAPHQWDFPNVWAPHQSWMVDLLMARGEEALAIHVARTFYENVRLTYQKHGVFFEKYRCDHPGCTGYRGEYVPQIGFGWTNGAIIDFIVRFHEKFVGKFDHVKSYQSVIKELALTDGK